MIRSEAAYYCGHGRLRNHRRLARALGTQQQRLEFILEMMREMSRLRDPQKVVKAYGARFRQIFPTDGMVSLSRRDLPTPQYRITRSSKWEGDINPWKQKDRLPVFDRGLLGDLLYADTATVIDEISVPDDDPALSICGDSAL